MSGGIVSVVAGGWSFRGDGWFEKADKLPGTVIGVNDAGTRLLRCDEIVSMDRLWTEGRWSMMQKLQRPAYIRQDALKKIPEAERVQPWLHPFKCDFRSWAFSDKPDTINGTNSGTCGVGRSEQHKPDEVYLFAFDMQPGPNNEAHWYPQYEWQPKVNGRKLDWAAQFKEIAAEFAARGIKVYNASSRSLITAFPKVTPKELGI